MRLPAIAALIPLALLPLLPVSPTGPQEQIPTVQEPETDVRFPVTITVVDKDTQHDLVGVGVRVKRKFFMDFNVYAMGFYLDQEGALEALREPAGKLSASKLETSKKFREALLGDTFGKTMRLVMVRDVDADDMAEAFEDVLWPRIKEYVIDKKDRDKEQRDRTAAKQALDTFRGYFEKEAEEDQVMDFTWLPGGKLYAVVDGKRHKVVQNEALSWALFDVFLGDDPISEDANEAFHEGLHELLHPKK